MKFKFNLKPKLNSKKLVIPIAIITIAAASSIGFLAFKSSAESDLDKDLISMFNTVEPSFKIEYRFLNRESMAIKITGIKEPMIQSPIPDVVKKMEFPNLVHLKRDLITSNGLRSTGSDVSIYYNIQDLNSNKLWDLGESIYIVNRGLINDMFEETLPQDLSFFGLNNYTLKTEDNNILLELRFNNYLGPEEEAPAEDTAATEAETEPLVIHPIIDVDMSLIPSSTDRIFASKNDKDRKAFYIEYVQKENSINMDKLIPIFANPPIIYTPAEIEEE